MIKIYYYLDNQIHFYKNLISAYDFFNALKIKNIRKTFANITQTSPQIFQILKRVNLKNNDGEIETRIFLNSSQIVFCLEDNIEGVSFENIRDLGLRLYINALKHTPIEGWNYFKLNVVNKFLEILPEQKLLRSAEEDIKRKFRT